MKKVFTAVSTAILCLMPNIAFATEGAEETAEKASLLSNIWPALIVIVILLGLYFYANHKAKQKRRGE